MAPWPTAPAAPMEPAQRKLPNLKPDESTTTRVTGCFGVEATPAAWLVAFSISIAAVCTF